MNRTRTISVPCGSVADRIISRWDNDGENVSENIRKAIEDSQRTDALKRQNVALSWALARMGVCPALLEAPVKQPERGHFCSECAVMHVPQHMARPEWDGYYGERNRWSRPERRIIEWCRSIIAPLEHEWIREYPREQREIRRLLDENHRELARMNALLGDEEE